MQCRYQEVIIILIYKLEVSSEGEISGDENELKEKVMQVKQ